MYSAKQQANEVRRKEYFASLLNHPALLKLAERLKVAGPAHNRALSVNVIKLHGPISSTSKKALNIDNLSPLIEAAFNKKTGFLNMHKTDLVVLDINCPGGAPAQSELIANEIRRRANETKIPVIACVQDVAASGGYWIACAADQIYAPKTAMIGSIGVISASFGLHETLERMGIERRITKSADAKGAGDIFSPQSPQDQARVQSIVNDLHQDFKTWVAARRLSALNNAGQDVNELANAQIWLGKAALENGLIDGIAALPEILSKIAPEQIHRVFVHQIKERKGLSRVFDFNAQSLGRGIAEAVIEQSEQSTFHSKLRL